MKSRCDWVLVRSDVGEVLDRSLGAASAGMDCRLCAAAETVAGGDLWVRLPSVARIGGFGHDESERDLALMVTDFLEDGSGEPDSWCSGSDSDSGFPDLGVLADQISFHRHFVDKPEDELLSVVHFLMLSLKEMDLRPVKSAPCNASCIRFSMVKLLRLSGYDAAVCASRWESSGRLPGGDYEYIDVVNYDESGVSERLIIDIDFRSHFEIARAVDMYGRILASLPVVFVGSLSKLKQFLHVMVDAAKFSLKQNSMPLPPWRSLSYLQAKWQSPYERLLDSDEPSTGGGISFECHKHCCGHLQRLQYSLQSEVEANCLLKPLNSENQRLTWWHPS